MVARLLIAAVFLLVACGETRTVTVYVVSPAPPTFAAAPSADPSPTPPALDTLMTKPSGFRGLFIPVDSQPYKTAASTPFSWSTQAGTVDDISSYYDRVVKAAGWTFSPSGSITNPRKLGGYSYYYDYCKGQPPNVVDIGISVGADPPIPADVATRKYAIIIFSDVPPDSINTCP